MQTNSFYFNLPNLSLQEFETDQVCPWNYNAPHESDSYRPELWRSYIKPEMLKFHPFSILTGETMVEFVIFWMLSQISSEVQIH